MSNEIKNQKMVTIQIEESVFDEMTAIMEDADKDHRSLIVYGEMMELIVDAVLDRQQLTINEKGVIVIDGLDIYSCVKAARHANKIKKAREENRNG